MYSAAATAGVATEISRFLCFCFLYGARSPVCSPGSHSGIATEITWFLFSSPGTVIKSPDQKTTEGERAHFDQRLGHRVHHGEGMAVRE